MPTTASSELRVFRAIRWRAIAIDAAGFVYAAGSLHEPASSAPQRNLYKLDATHRASLVDIMPRVQT